MNAVADHPLATVMRAETLNGLPDWVTDLAQQCPDYRFAPCDVFRGRSVAAMRMTPGSGVYVVVTANEVEMRQALGLPARADAESCPATARARPVQEGPGARTSPTGTG